MKGASPGHGSALARELVAHHFDVAGGMLSIGGIAATTLAGRFGTPLFVYDASVLRGQYRRLAETLAGFAEVYYSIKANPNPAIAGIFVAEGAGLEIASAGELLLARRAGCSPARMLFAGPGKGAEELGLAVAAGVGEIHIETFEEIERIAAIGRRLDRRVPVAVRINPSAAAQGGAMRMGGKPASFGFDEETLDDVARRIEAQPSLDLRGLHLFAGTQILDAAVLAGQWRYGLELAARLARRLGRSLATIDLGGGLGVPYHDNDARLDLAALREHVVALTREVAAEPAIRASRVVVEPGRFLTASAGVYLMGVNAVKASRGTRFVIADGGMHHHLAASGNLGQVIKRDYPIVLASRVEAEADTAAVVVGPLCTPLDTLGRQVHLPAVAAGDLVAVLQSGAYALSASPVGFLGHPMPAEVLVDRGEARIIRPRGSFEQPFTLPA
jgi:diaminopimelate decarboxylase